MSLATDLTPAEYALLPATVEPSLAAFWDEVALSSASRADGTAWRAVSDAVNLDLVGRWLEPVPTGRILKTDLFDEYVGRGLVSALSSSFAGVAGIDVSPTLVREVQQHHPDLEARVADVRNLPFCDGEFAAVLSNSTLDHFESQGEIARSLHELHRVLSPGGTLLVTLDNGLNPVVAVRNALPARWRDGSTLVPYRVGATVRRPRELQSLLEDAGFHVEKLDAILHCPRVLGVLAGTVVDRRGRTAARRAHNRALEAFEHLGRLPTRFVTGHFIAALARKR